MPIQKSTKNKLRLLSKLLFVASVLLIIVGIWHGVGQHKANKAAVRYAEQTTQAANNGAPSPAPSTVEPSDAEFQAHATPPQHPRHLFIPVLGVKAIVKPMGLTADNHIESPTNVHYAGWFTQSALPGQPGAVVIDGHVSAWKTRSVFYDLKKLRPGDIITVRRGDGKELSYAVTESKSYAADAVDMQAALSPVNPDKPGLNLITCDGKVIKGNEYDRRLVVFAEQL